jgi:ABC-type nitrate/sulfonate/bicarbonate transport system substrate-binding protein
MRGDMRGNGPALPSRRAFLRATMLAAGAALLSACGQAAPPAPTSPPAQPGGATAAPGQGAASAEKIAIGINGSDASYGPLFVGMDAGLFQKHGVAPDIVTMAGGGKAVQGLVANQVDMSIGGGPGCVAAELQGAPIRIVASTQNTFLGKFFGAPGITSPDQLKGKSWGITAFGGAADVAARVAAKKWGLTPDVDVTIVAISDAADQPVLGDVKEVVGEYVTNPLAVSTDFIANRRTTLHNFLAGMGEASKLFNSNRDAGIQAITHWVQLEEKPQLAQQSYDFFVNTIPAGLTPSLEGLQLMLDTSTDPKAKTTKPEDLVSVDVLQQVAKEGWLP